MRNGTPIYAEITEAPVKCWCESTDYGQGVKTPIGRDTTSHIIHLLKEHHGKS